MKRNYISELEWDINTGTGTKINIHLPVGESGLSYCINLNSDLQKIAPSRIDFSPASFHIPHITLYMGYVESTGDYNNILNKLYELSKSISSFEITPGKPYLKGKEKNYVFLDFEESEKILLLKRLIYSEIKKWITPLTWDVVNENPHITIGYIEENFGEVESFLSNYAICKSIVAGSFQISLAGMLGTCLGSLRTFPFQINSEMR